MDLFMIVFLFPLESVAQLEFWMNIQSFGWTFIAPTKLRFVFADLLKG